MIRHDTLERAKRRARAEEELDRLVIVKSVIYTRANATESAVPAPGAGNATDGRRPALPRMRRSRPCRLFKLASPPPITCCRAAPGAESGADERSSSPACCTISPSPASSAAITATGRAARGAVRRREVSWPSAITGAAVLPDESVGYQYPAMYTKLFGPTTSRSPTSSALTSTPATTMVHDLPPADGERPLRFDPTVQVALEEFTDVVGRHFKHPRKDSASTAPLCPHVAHHHVADAVPVGLHSGSPSPRCGATLCNS